MNRHSGHSEESDHSTGQNPHHQHDGAPPPHSQASKESGSGDQDHHSMPMAERGVTRHGHGNSHDHSPGEEDSHSQHHDHHEMMSPEHRREMMVEHHKNTLWIWWLVIILGLWMMAAPLSFDYGRAAAQPSGGRDVWLSLDARVLAMRLSDFMSGLLLVIFGWRILTPGRPISQWAACFVGIWLQVAPLFFWCPSAAAYLNDTLVGALVIALTILIPGMPAMVMYMKMGPEIPPGWTYNPSSWPQRGIMIALGFAGWLVSRLLAAFQLGYTDSAWDPFFGESTRLVLNSRMSHMWPVSDAALGAVAYTLEFLMGWMGSPARWRTMPWMVLFFGILVVPLGLTHIILVISQPVIVGHWCTLCLLAAAIMLPMIPLTLDEVVAMCQFMYRAVKQNGQPFWRTFWKGGTIEGGGPDNRSPELVELPQSPLRVYRASVWGVSLPWTLVVSSALGLFLMFAPAILGFTQPSMAAHSDHLTGALVLTVAVIAMAEVVRPFRWLNCAAGAWLITAPWMLDGFTAVGQFNDVLVGLLLVGLSIPRGKVLEHYGKWDKFVR